LALHAGSRASIDGPETVRWKDQCEPLLAIGNASDRAVDPGIGARDKRFLQKTHARIVKPH
jgi:hypothetical protein